MELETHGAADAMLTRVIDTGTTLHTHTPYTTHTHTHTHTHEASAKTLSHTTEYKASPNGGGGGGGGGGLHIPYTHIHTHTYTYIHTHTYTYIHTPELVPSKDQWLSPGAPNLRQTRAPRLVSSGWWGGREKPDEHRRVRVRECVHWQFRNDLFHDKVCKQSEECEPKRRKCQRTCEESWLEKVTRVDSRTRVSVSTAAAMSNPASASAVTGVDLLYALFPTMKRQVPHSLHPRDSKSCSCLEVLDHRLISSP